MPYALAPFDIVNSKVWGNVSVAGELVNKYNATFNVDHLIYFGPLL